MFNKQVFIIFSSTLFLVGVLLQVLTTNKQDAHALTNEVSAIAFTVASNLIDNNIVKSENVISEFAYLLTEDEEISFLEGEQKRKEEELRKEQEAEQARIEAEAAEKARVLEEQLAKQRAEEEAKRKAEEEAKRKAEEEAKRKAAEKAAKEQAAKEAADKAKREAAEKAAKEKAEKLAAQQKEQARSQQASQSKQTTTTQSSNSSAGEWMTFNATAYTAYCAGCSGVTANGHDLRKSIYKDGRLVVATDRSVIPMGTKLELKYPNGTIVQATAQDTGGAIKGRKIDIAHSTKDQAYAFGRKNIQVRIVK